MYDFTALTTKQVAELFQVDITTVTKWVRTRVLPPPRKIGRKFYFDKDNLNEWWEQKGREGERTYQPGL